MADTKISALTAATSVAIGDVLPIAQGGTTKKLDVKYLWGQRTTFSNANYGMAASDRYVATTTTAFTAQRTVTLPAANALNPGMLVMISDDGGAITSAFSLLVARAGTDTINKQANPINLKSTLASVILSTDGVSNWTIVARSPAQNVIVLTSGSAYTPSVGTKAIYVECVGGGAGGAGIAAAAGQANFGNGGGAGAYSAAMLNALKASYSYTIGVGGIGGVGAAIGTAGGQTTFDSPSVCTADGGSPGNTSGSGSGTDVVLGNNWGVGGLASNGVGDLKVDGGMGTPGSRWGGGGQANGGNGGGTFFGGGGSGRQSVAGQGNGNNATTPGGGGGGAASTSATAFNGGAGANGMIRLTEFF